MFNRNKKVIMKKCLSLCLSLCLSILIQAQVSKDVTITTAGSLASVLTNSEKNSITNLTISGYIDARDFVTLRDYMPSLTNLDLSNVTISAYTGTEGTFWNNVICSSPCNHTQKTVYNANTIPDDAFSRYSEVFRPAGPGHDLADYYPNSISNTSLSSVVLPSSLISIGDYSFKNCTNVTSIVLPSSVTSIGTSAFEDCSGLTSIILSSSLTSIGDFAFQSCSGLTSITIPSKVTSIGTTAFSSCSSLISIIIPTSITSIDFNTFSNCTKLKTVTIPSSVTSIGSDAFEDCSSLTSINIPSSVTIIGDYAFKGCVGLASISIPSSVTTIGNCFCNCDIIVDVNNLKYSSVDGILFNKLKTILISCPNSKTGNYTIPSSVTYIGENAFSGSNLTSINIPSSVTTLGYNAFSGSSLTSIILSEGLTEIESYVFASCKKISSIIIPSTVKQIGTSVFSSCVSLSSVTILSTDYYLDFDAFEGCINLTAIKTFNPIPQGQGSSLFKDVDKNACTIYVPNGSKGSFLTNTFWGEFKNIVEFSTTGLTTIEPTKILISPNPASSSFILISQDNAIFQIFSTNGKLVMSKYISRNEQIFINNLSQGLYILKLISDNGISIKNLIIE